MILLLEHIVDASRVHHCVEAWCNTDRSCCDCSMLSFSFSTKCLHPSVSMQYQSIDESNHQFQPHSLPIHPYESNHSSVYKLSKQSISDLCVLFMMSHEKEVERLKKPKWTIVYVVIIP